MYNVSFATIMACPIVINFIFYCDIGSSLAVDHGFLGYVNNRRIFKEMIKGFSCVNSCFVVHRRNEIEERNTHFIVIVIA